MPPRNNKRGSTPQEGDSASPSKKVCLEPKKGLPTRSSSKVSVEHAKHTDPKQKIDSTKNVPSNCGKAPTLSAKDKTAAKTMQGGVNRQEIKPSFDVKKCTSWFREYTSSAADDVIAPEGMEKLCEDLGVEPENVVMLALAWKLNASQMGFFSLSEWLTGMTDLQCENTEQLRTKLEHLRSLLDDSKTFLRIYQFAFEFAKNSTHRCMDCDVARPMLGLLLGKRWSLFSQFQQFLESRYKAINRDQWSNIYEFSEQYKLDMSNYDEDGAWPVLLDEFVTWYRHQTLTTTT